jgi:hypothetical protein
MKKTFLFTWLIFYGILSAQHDPIELNLEKMFEYRQLEEIILHADRSEDYTAKSLYYIGRSFFLVDEDDKALEFLNFSITKNDQDPEAFFYRGIV